MEAIVLNVFYLPHPCQFRCQRQIVSVDAFYCIRFIVGSENKLVCVSQVNLLQMAEYRISIYGRKQSEWDQLASWFVNNEIYSDNAVWLIQVTDNVFSSFFVLLPMTSFAMISCLLSYICWISAIMFIIVLGSLDMAQMGWS